MMRIRLHNIGPLRDADIEFAPLTVLVGPNGSGKTTFTSVVYALLRAHEAALLEAFELLEPTFEEEEGDFKASKHLTGDIVDTWQDSFTENLDFELRRCCAPDLGMLARARRGGKNAGPRITISTDRWCMVFRLSGDNLILETSHPDFRRPRLRLRQGSRMLFARKRVREGLTGDLPRRGVYFPAGRSGIVLTHTALSALMAGALSGGYFQDATIGAIPGPTADFMQLVAQIRPRRSVKRTSKVAGSLEHRLLRGKVRLDDRGSSREFLFRPEGHDVEWPVENMATAVAEFTPLVLYLRHRANPGDSVLIDEPESHLHPESQVSLAEGLIELASVLSPVIVATHSELLVSSLSNQLLSRASKPANRNDATKPLAVYAFTFHDEDRGLGVDVNPVNVAEDEGFEIDQFSDVTDRVFEESIQLYNRLHTDSEN